MEKDTLLDSKLEHIATDDDVVPIAVSNEQQQQRSVQQHVDSSSRTTIKRENDSMDDFEHLEHEGSSALEDDENSRNSSERSILDVTSVQLIDVPRAAPNNRVSELMDVASKLERNILDTSIPVDERILQPVPATPPPSADFEKYDEQQQQQARKQIEGDGVDVANAQSLRHFTEQQEGITKNQEHQVSHGSQVDTKAATMAFMDTERSSYIGGGFHNIQQQQIPFGEGPEEKQHGNTKDGNTIFDSTKQQIYPGHKINEAYETVHRDTTLATKTEDKDETSNLATRLAPDKKTEDKWDNEENKQEEEEVKRQAEFDKQLRELKDQKHQDNLPINIASSVIPDPYESPEFDYLANDNQSEAVKKSETRNIVDDDTWNVVEKPGDHHQQQQQQKSIETKNLDKKYTEDHEPSRADLGAFDIDVAPTKPLPPLPKSEFDEYADDEFIDFAKRTDFNRDRGNEENYEVPNEFIGSGGVEIASQLAQREQKHQSQQQQQQQSGTEAGDSEFESAPEQSPAKSSSRSSANEPNYYSSQQTQARKINADDIALKNIFCDMGLDAWFNPERLNPKVAALIYWRQPEKTGIVFGAILVVLLSLTYFSLISVFAYLSLITIILTTGFRIYKTLVQAVQKTSDGHPFKELLEVDLTLPAEKVHEVADVAVGHANAAVSELRRLFLVEDFIDSIKFGFALWCCTYLGSWFNGMSLIIIGVVALFTLPKVYETNKAQIDQNVALVHGKINELTAKIKAAIPLGKKSEPTKEE